jgi:hypothetical protein
MTRTYQSGSPSSTAAAFGLLVGLSNYGISQLCCADDLAWVWRDVLRFVVTAYWGSVTPNLLGIWRFLPLVWHAGLYLCHLATLLEDASIIASLLPGC